MRVGREPGWPELKVGIIAIVAVLFLAFMVIRIERGTGMFSRREEVQALLRDTKGLRVGSPVQFAGVESGTVKALDIGQDGMITMTLQVHTKVRPFIKSSSRLSIESMGVLGDKFILIKPGTSDDPPLAKGELLTSELVGGSAADLVSDSAHAISAGRLAMEKLNEVMEKLASSRGTAGKLLDDPALYDELHGVLKGLNKAFSGKGSFDQLDSAIVTLEKVMKNLNSPQGTVGKLIHEDKLYQQSSVLLEELTLLARDIRENPKKYFKVSVF